MSKQYCFETNADGDVISVEVPIKTEDINLAIQVANLVENYYKAKSNKLTVDHLAVLNRVISGQCATAIQLEFELRTKPSFISIILADLEKKGFIESVGEAGETFGKFYYPSAKAYSDYVLKRSKNV